MTTLLLCGSRALCVGRGGTVESERWARERIAVAVPDYARGDVVTGDAVGPDLWASSEAMGWATRWCLDGTVRCALAPFLTDDPAWVIERRWHNDPLPRRGDREGWKVLCLARDREMVAALPDGARVLALVAPWSKTKGAAYTARCARERGLVVTVETCPAEYGATEGVR